jgi:hypothetical protein
MAGTIRTGFAETAMGAVQANSGGNVAQGNPLVLQSARCVLCGGTLPPTCGWDWTRQSLVVRSPDLWLGLDQAERTFPRPVVGTYQAERTYPRPVVGTYQAERTYPRPVVGIYQAEV